MTTSHLTTYSFVTTENELTCIQKQYLQYRLEFLTYHEYTKGFSFWFEIAEKLQNENWDNASLFYCRVSTFNYFYNL